MMPPMHWGTTLIWTRRCDRGCTQIAFDVYVPPRSDRGSGSDRRNPHSSVPAKAAAATASSSSIKEDDDDPKLNHSTSSVTAEATLSLPSSSSPAHFTRSAPGLPHVYVAATYFTNRQGFTLLRSSNTCWNKRRTFRCPLRPFPMPVPSLSWM